MEERMKTKVILVACVAALLLVSGSMFAQDEKPWIDMEKCAFCKQLSAQEGLIENMHREYHNIDDGIIQITNVDPEYHDMFEKAQHNIEKVAADMQSGGEMPYMCGHCEAYGAFMMASVKPECVESEDSHVCVMIGDTPEMVEKLHKFADKSNAEIAKLMGEEEEAESE
jgi:hypothetical protein